MGKNERTGKRVGKLAGEALADPKASKREKSLAASALTQRPARGPRKKRKRRKG
jgi:hypothetical protein